MAEQATGSMSALSVPVARPLGEATRARAVRIDELTLIASARAGDASAFGALVRIYQDTAYNLAYRLLGHPDRAADATQEAFTAAYRGLRAYRGGSFRAWLLRIVTNCCYDQLRVERRQPQPCLEEMAEGAEYAPALVDRREGPEETLLRQELLRTIESGLARLPWDQRMVLVLADVQGLSYDEIAQIAGASLGTVKSRLHRARLRLRDHLAPQGNVSRAF